MPCNISREPNSGASSPSDLDEQLIVVGQYLTWSSWIVGSGIVGWANFLVNKLVLGDGSCRQIRKKLGWLGAERETVSRHVVHQAQALHEERLHLTCHIDGAGSLPWL